MPDFTADARYGNGKWIKVYIRECANRHAKMRLVRTTQKKLGLEQWAWIEIRNIKEVRGLPVAKKPAHTSASQQLSLL